MVMLQLYITGGYLAILIYSLLLDNNGFREYIESFAETVKKMCEIKKTHPYTLMQIFGVLLLLISWLGLIVIGILLFDYFKNYRKK